MQKIDVQDFKPKVIGILLVLATVAVGGFALITKFAEADLNRDMKMWQEKLNLIADSRAREVNEWVGNHFVEMKRLSEQPALQLYLSEIDTLDKAAQNSAEPPQRAYLRNLLTFTADRLGFIPGNVPLSVQQIPAQIPFSTQSGLAILNYNAEIVAASPFLAELPEPVKQRLIGFPKNMQSMIDIYNNEKGEGMIGFVQPIFGIQADPAAAEAVGQIIGLKPIGDSLAKLLTHPGITEKSLEILLLRSESGNIVYLSPTVDGSVPLAKKISNDPQKLAEAFVVANPQAFVESSDYVSNKVFATGRVITGTPWTMVVKINKEEALRESDARRSNMLMLFSTLIAFIIATIFAVWYFSSSRRAILASSKFQQLADSATANERLLKLVTNNQVESVYLLDNESHYRFLNHTASENIGVDVEAVIGKHIADVIGPARSSELTLRLQAAALTHEPQTYIHKESTNHGEKVIRTHLIPLHELPLADHKKTPGVLVSEQDITALMQERERAERTQQQLLDTLVSMVDRRDPNAFNHSKLVCELAEEIAIAVDADKQTRETAKTAGLLLNVGKIIVPENILTSTDKLDEAELKSIRESVYSSAALLSNVSFEGPVVETLNQSLEHVNGSGPQGLKGAEILLSARIVAVANALVGMISPRSYREAMPIEEASKQLIESVDKVYDRKIVFALINFLENQGGSSLLQSWVETRKAA